MIPENALRIIEVKQEDSWIQCRFDQLEKDDIYRMRERDTGEVVVNDKGISVWRVLNQAQIEVESFKENS